MKITNKTYFFERQKTEVIADRYMIHLDDIQTVSDNHNSVNNYRYVEELLTNEFTTKADLPYELNRWGNTAKKVLKNTFHNYHTTHLINKFIIKPERYEELCCNFLWEGVRD